MLPSLPFCLTAEGPNLKRRTPLPPPTPQQASLSMRSGTPWTAHQHVCNNEYIPAESSDVKGHLISVDKNRFFFDHYGLTERDLEHYLAAALSAGGDYADLYFEYLSSTSLWWMSPWSSPHRRASRRVRRPCHFRRADRLRLHR